MDQSKRKKFYIPGYLALLILFPVFYFYLQKQDGFNGFSVLEINWVNPKVNKNYILDQINLGPYGYYLNFKLTGNDASDKETLRLAHLEMKKQKLFHNNKKGVHFQFEDKAKYWTLVKVFDFCLQENAKRIIPYNEDIWVLQF